MEDRHQIEQIPAVVHDDEYLRIMRVGHYRYAERKGKDSVAFILFDDSRFRNGFNFGLIHEFKPPIRSWLTTAYGGSIDSNLPLNRLVQREVEEEAGLKVTMDAIISMGSYFVSTQMNQFCHLFIAHVNPLYLLSTDKRAAENTDALERLSSPVWLTEDQVRGTQCWKAQIILNRHLINKGANHGIELNQPR